MAAQLVAWQAAADLGEGKRAVEEVAATEVEAAVASGRTTAQKEVPKEEVGQEVGTLVELKVDVEAEVGGAGEGEPEGRPVKEVDLAVAPEEMMVVVGSAEGEWGAAGSGALMVEVVDAVEHEQAQTEEQKGAEVRGGERQVVALADTEAELEATVGDARVEGLEVAEAWVVSMAGTSAVEGGASLAASLEEETGVGVEEAAGWGVVDLVGMRAAEGESVEHIWGQKGEHLVEVGWEVEESEEMMAEVEAEMEGVKVASRGEGGRKGGVSEALVVEREGSGSGVDSVAEKEVGSAGAEMDVDVQATED